ncbi:MAG: ATP-binding protein [Clostridia bacterium]|nr:ATP-binding protein [Clostridia bacterium]
MKASLIEKAKKIIEDRRYDAVSLAQSNKIEALKNEEFKKIYYAYLDSMQADAKEGKDSSRQTIMLEGEYLDWLKEHEVGEIMPQYSCKKCEDSGYVNGKYCDCLVTEINELLKKESGFLNLERFDDANFEIFEEKEKIKKLYSKMKEWCYSNFDKTLIFLAGQTGVGKTHLMKCMANELIGRQKLVLLTTSFAMNQDFLKSYSTRDLEEKNHLLDKYLTAEILFIDDLGTELRQRDITTQFLYQVLNERKMQKRPTVITSNLNLDDIMEYYDERISSRISDKETSISIYLKGKDLRLLKY